MPNNPEPADGAAAATPAVSYARLEPGARGGRRSNWPPLLLAGTVVLVLIMLLYPQFLPEDPGPRFGLTRAAVESGLSGALGLYKVHVGHFPTTDEGGLNALVGSNPATQPAGWQGPYLKGPRYLLDAWGQRFAYRCPGIHNPKTYDLSSTGPDGVFGTNDDIRNW